MIRETSLSAYRELMDSGKGETQRAVVLRAIMDNGPVTRSELSRLTRIPINAICGRVNELLASKAIEEPDKRKCSVTGREVFSLAPIGDDHKQGSLF